MRADRGQRGEVRRQPRGHRGECVAVEEPLLDVSFLEPLCPP
jgi:hypothetical protein